MITTALFFGLLSGLSSFIVFLKMPIFLQNFMIRRPFIAEILSMLLIFFTITSITSSAIGVFTAIIAEFVWSLLYLGYRRHPESPFYEKMNSVLGH